MGLHDANRDNALPVTVNSNVDRFCDLQSHFLCRPHECDIKEIGDKLEAISEGQIKIAITTSITGLLVSTIFAVALISVWVAHAIHGRPMPDVPWFVISVALVPFSSALTMRIPKKTQYRIGTSDD